MTHRSVVRHAGTVLTFDAAAGYGTVGDAGGEWFFHCTAIADGTRTIQEGTGVTFAVVPGHRGRHEAVGLQPV